MLKDIEIEKYKMLISMMPEDKAKEAIEMIKNALYKDKPLLEVKKFITKNAKAYIVKDFNEIKGKDLTDYRVVMFDSNFNGVNVFPIVRKR